VIVFVLSSTNADGDGDHRTHPRDRNLARARHPASQLLRTLALEGMVLAASARPWARPIGVRVSDAALYIVPVQMPPAAGQLARFTADVNVDPTMYALTVLAMVAARDAGLGRGSHCRPCTRRSSTRWPTPDPRGLVMRNRFCSRRSRWCRRARSRKTFPRLLKAADKYRMSSDNHAGRHPDQRVQHRRLADKERRLHGVRASQAPVAGADAEPGEKGQKVLMLGDRLLAADAREPAPSHHADAEAARRRQHRVTSRR